MNDTISPLIEKSGAFEEVLKCIRGGQLPCSVFGVTQNAKPYFAEAVRRSVHKQVLCITATEQSARDLASATGGILFPDDDFSLRSVEAKGREAELVRVGILKNTAHIKGVVFLSARAFLSRMMPPECFAASCFLLKAGDNYDMDGLMETLTKNGYEHAGTVYSKGEFARRGEILDIFPSDSKRPVRVTFFDDEIESIRFFDSETQKSQGSPLGEYLLPPAREVVLGEDAKEKLYEYLKKQDNSELAERLSVAVEEYGTLDNADTFLPVMFSPAYITDYFPDALLLFDDFEYVYTEAGRVKAEFDDACARLVKEGEAFLVQCESIGTLTPVLKKQEGRILDMAGGKNARLKTVCEADMQLRAAPGYNGRIDMLAEAIKDRVKHGYAVGLYAGGKAKSLSEALKEFDMIAPVLAKPQEKGVFVSEEYIPYGFEIPSARTIVLGLN
ncbi:MAG: hypothetical protein VB081_11505, partial [Christensenella sp.]|uniref:hypothetical protein n=1 Tax=Christensenella sp. TaxID=1935934 RepID=UPI002B214F16